MHLHLFKKESYWFIVVGLLYGRQIDTFLSLCKDSVLSEYNYNDPVSNSKASMQYIHGFFGIM